MQRPPPLGRVDLDLGASFLEEGGAEPLQLLAELRQGESLLLARGVHPLRVGGQPRLVCGHRLALLLAELDELSLELPLAAVQVSGPRHQPLLQPLLHRCDGLSELDARAFGLALDRVPPSPRPDAAPAR